MRYTKPLYSKTTRVRKKLFNNMTHLQYRCGMGGLSGAVLPPLYTTCLDKCGYKATLIGWFFACLTLTVSGLLGITSRVPPKQASKPTTKDFDFVRRPRFWILLLTTIIQGLAHYLPSLYLPSYALDMGLSSAEGSLLVSLLTSHKQSDSRCKDS